MTKEENVNEVLDAFNFGGVTKTELQWLIPLVLERGPFDTRTLTLYITGIDIDSIDEPTNL